MIKLAASIASFALIASISTAASAGLAASNKLANHQVRRYQRLYNRGLVKNAKEFNKLHPFARANGTRLARGELPTMTVVKNLARGTTVRTSGRLKTRGRVGLQALSRWLSGRKTSRNTHAVTRERSMRVRLEVRRHWAPARGGRSATVFTAFDKHVDRK
ncbi:MAG: hypothetical protein CSB49_02820 [Proteobacteria bacterium]|nr:MAG: hypothetical protein CSB49_02820 [Pseudomonadota bacterium]